MAGGYAGNLGLYFIGMKVVGGREGIRTPDPLLAKRAGENTNVLCWCRLHGKSTKSPLPKCPDVVPSFAYGQLHLRKQRGHSLRYIGTYLE